MIGSRKKAKFRNYNYFFTTTTKLFYQIRMKGGGDKKVGLSKEQAKFEKVDVGVVEDGMGKGRGRASKKICFCN